MEKIALVCGNCIKNTGNYAEISTQIIPLFLLILLHINGKIGLALR